MFVIWQTFKPDACNNTVYIYSGVDKPHIKTTIIRVYEVRVMEWWSDTEGGLWRGKIERSHDMWAVGDSK